MLVRAVAAAQVVVEVGAVLRCRPSIDALMPLVGSTGGRLLDHGLAVDDLARRAAARSLRDAAGLAARVDVERVVAVAAVDVVDARCRR